MQKNKRRTRVPQIGSMLIALGVVTAAHAITGPIQTQRGMVRLGSKTQANVDANRSSVALGQGMVMVSSNPGGFGRPTIGVSFNGAPMFAKVQGTALVAYLPGAFIEITEVEGRTYLFRKGSFGENVAIDAGKMLLVKPGANRLPDTADVNLGHLVNHSAILKGAVGLAAWPLIARAIDKQSKNRYLKPTPIYFDGAGTEVLVEGKGGEVPSQKARVEGQPLSTSLTATEAVEQIPRRFAPEQLVASISSTGSAGVTAGGPGVTPGGPGVTPGGPGVTPGGPGVDVSGAPALTTVTANTGTDIPPSRGFLEQFKVTAPEDGGITTMWFPIGFTGVRDNFASDHLAVASTRSASASAAGFDDPDLQAKGTVGLVQGVFPASVGGFNNLVFKEAQIADPRVANFKISSLGETSSVVLKFSQAEIPSDILNKDQFIKAFTPPGTTNVPTHVIVNVDNQGFGIPFPSINTPSNLDNFLNTRKMPRRELTINVPAGQTVTISDPGFFAGDKPTMPGPYAQEPPGSTKEQPTGTLFGLAKPTFMGSVFVQASGKGVSVKVGDRIVRDVTVTETLDHEETVAPPGQVFPEISDPPGSNSFGEPPPDKDENAPKSQIVVGEHLVKGGFTFASGDPGVFSLQAPAPTGSLAKASILDTTPSFTIQSDGPLQISDPGPGVLTSVAVVSKQDVGVRSTSSDGELVFSKAALHAGQGITVSSAKRIRLENSSQLNALTAVVMLGAGRAGLELVSSTIKTTNGQILLDLFDRIEIDSAQLMASVIKARVISPNGVLRITASTLDAGTLLRLYAEGSNGTVEFVGAVTLKGNRIDIAGNTVRVTLNSSVTTGQNTTVYANTHDYNKPHFGTINNPPHQQNFAARPPF